MRGTDWTDERIKLLKKLWSEGKTAAAIGARLGGMSRSAVLGKVFRLRLAPADAGAIKPQAANNATPRVSRNDSLSRRRGAAARKNLPQQSPVRSTTRGKSLLELTNDSCRWPHGQPGTKAFHFCGAAGADLEGGVPYCERHARRAYLGGGKSSEKPSPATAPDSMSRPKSPSTTRDEPTPQQQRIVASMRGRFF